MTPTTPGGPTNAAAPASPSGPTTATSRWHVSKESVTGFMPVVVLLALLVGLTVAKPSFASVASAQVLAEQTSILLVLCVGQTLVIMLGGIDLALAAMASLASILIGLWLPTNGIFAILGVLTFTTLAGALTGFVHAKAQVPSFIITLGTLGIWSGFALALSAGTTIPVREHYDLIGWMADRTGPIPNSAAVALVFVGLVMAAMRLLPMGRYVEAIGLAEPAAVMSGIRTVRAKTLIFALSGFGSGLAALMLVARMNSGAPSLADSLQLPTVAAVVVGGTAITGGVGGLNRTIVGALIIMVLRVGMAVIGIDAAYEQIVYGGIVILAVGLTIDRARILIVK